MKRKKEGNHTPAVAALKTMRHGTADFSIYDSCNATFSKFPMPKVYITLYIASKQVHHRE